MPEPSWAESDTLRSNAVAAFAHGNDYIYTRCDLVDGLGHIAARPSVARNDIDPSTQRQRDMATPSSHRLP
ncbi:hypothetical protein ACQP1G_23785 [Nocardia sp. CA-107356]|uniref:hypothetical protein n=1 Tax=Nocardia sp. CA-107356 TaxID=3239972 RepID=UPI003D8A66BC